MAITQIQEAHSYAFSTQKPAFALTLATAGDLLVTWVVYTGTGAILSDTAGNVWSRLGTDLIAGFGTLSAAYTIAKSSGSTTITWTASGGGNLGNAAGQAVDFNGTASSSVLDATNQQASATNSASAAVLAHFADLIFACTIPPSGGKINTYTSGFTVCDGNPATGLSAEYQVEPGSGTYTPSVVASNTSVGIIVGAFKPLGASSGRGNWMQAFRGFANKRGVRT